jgi:hypothetical protein
MEPLPINGNISYNGIGLQKKFLKRDARGIICV